MLMAKNYKNAAVTVEKRRRKSKRYSICNQVHCALQAGDAAEIAVQNTENEYRPSTK